MGIFKYQHFPASVDLMEQGIEEPWPLTLNTSERFLRHPPSKQLDLSLCRSLNPAAHFWEIQRLQQPVKRSPSKTRTVEAA